jgi:hypothetical protein
MVTGDGSQVSEEVLSYELGYRTRLGSLGFDMAAFVNRYDHLRDQQMGAMSLEEGPNGPFVLVPLTITGLGGADVLGVEMSAKWAVSSDWRLEAGYTRQEIDLEFPFLHPFRDTEEGVRSPQDQFHLRSMVNLGRDLELDAWLRHTGSLPHERGVMDAYSGADVRLGWAPTRELRLDLGGKDLLKGRHQEFPNDAVYYNIGPHIDRSWFAKMTWIF